MATDEVKKYIEQRYDRWHDYAAYHCSCAGIPDESIDVLNEVLCNLLQRPREKIAGLLKKSGKYTELDYYVLRMIKLNATSPTSPYQHKYKPLPVDANVDYSRLDLVDEDEEDHDRPAEILEKMNRVREIVGELNLSDYAKELFMWRMSGESWEDWSGDETDKELFDVFYKIRDMVREKLNGETLF